MRPSVTASPASRPPWLFQWNDGMSSDSCLKVPENLKSKNITNLNESVNNLDDLGKAIDKLCLKLISVTLLLLQLFFVFSLQIFKVGTNINYDT